MSWQRVTRLRPWMIPTLRTQIAQAELAVSQSQNGLAQVQVELDTLILDVPLRQAEAQQAEALAEETLSVAERRLNGFGQPASEALITSGGIQCRTGQASS